MFMKIENLHKKYGDKYAVKDFSVHVKEKEFICLLGPSGCGKTTVLRAIGGFLTDLSGRIELTAGYYRTACPFAPGVDRVSVLRFVSAYDGPEK